MKNWYCVKSLPKVGCCSAATQRNFFWAAGSCRANCRRSTFRANTQHRLHIDFHGVGTVRADTQHSFIMNSHLIVIFFYIMQVSITKSARRSFLVTEEIKVQVNVSCYQYSSCNIFPLVFHVSQNISSHTSYMSTKQSIMHREIFTPSPPAVYLAIRKIKSTLHGFNAPLTFHLSAHHVLV